tara:strand:- start:1719 stop:2072 length:354 start_codon:yes stop_codon:yes gene_type:complete
MAKILVAIGLSEFANDVFNDYPELSSSEDVHNCLKNRKDQLKEYTEMWGEEININKLQSSIEELLNCQNASELKTKFNQSELYFSEAGVEESESPFEDFDSLGEAEKNDFWDFRFGG